MNKITCQNCKYGVPVNSSEKVWLCNNFNRKVSDKKHGSKFSCGYGVLWNLERRCRVCGCTDDDCEQCIEKTGEPCHWVEDDLCSACAEM